jgi:hypothetical protein
MIKINQFTDATYLIYESKASNYSKTCTLDNKTYTRRLSQIDNEKVYVIDESSNDIDE